MAVIADVFVMKLKEINACTSTRVAVVVELFEALYRDALNEPRRRVAKNNFICEMSTLPRTDLARFLRWLEEFMNLIDSELTNREETQLAKQLESIVLSG